MSEYTDRIDVYVFRNKAQRIHAQLRDICSILSGLMVACDYEAGQQLIVGRQFKDNAAFFQCLFEIARRHKIMNPEKMRDTYGKLIYMLMDGVQPAIEELLEFSCVRPILTVHALLETRGALDLLRDPDIAMATTEIAHDARRPRMETQRLIKTKERAIEAIVSRYASSRLKAEEIRQCLYSIGDSSSYLGANRDPCDEMLGHLRRNFSPTEVQAGYSLAISGGVGGARLSHSHERQYHYVEQSLLLWREIADEMYHLWCMAEMDLLDQSLVYSLRDTGQGLNRVQSAPRTGRVMRLILHRCQQQVCNWVGSSVIHLGGTTARASRPPCTARIALRPARDDRRRPQCAQCADVHRQVHAGGSYSQPNQSDASDAAGAGP